MQGLRDNPAAHASRLIPLSWGEWDSYPILTFQTTQAHPQRKAYGREFWECSSPPPGCHITQSFHILISVLSTSFLVGIILELFRISVTYFSTYLSLSSISFSTTSSVPYHATMLPTSKWTNFKMNFGILFSCALCRWPVSQSVSSAQVPLDLCRHLLEARPFQCRLLLCPLVHQASKIWFSPWLHVWKLEKLFL